MNPVTPSAAGAPRLARRGHAAGAGRRFRRSRLRLLLSRLLPALGLGAGLACAGDHLTREPPREPAALYTTLALNHHAVTLSLLPPYDTLTLVATPRNALGEPMDTLGMPQYRSTDLDRVQVRDGVLHAVGLTADGQPITVVATLTAGNLTHVDTVLVKVVADTLPKLASLSLHPVPPDSAKIPIEGNGVVYTLLPIQAIDSNGSSMSDSLLVAVRSLDTLTARIYERGGSPVVRGRRLGVATLVASATVFGVGKADTVPYRVGWPIFTQIEIIRQVPVAGGNRVSAFNLPTIRVGAGAVVFWVGAEGDTIDVTFADADTASVAPADSTTTYFVHIGKIFRKSGSEMRNFYCTETTSDCEGSGSFVLAPETYPRAYRVFPKPGTYEYHSTRYGTTGRIVVMDER